jgi:NADH-quinone oxidoreductase subunit L
VFVLGALALAGFPLLNGFWSKELLLESGSASGPRWAYWAMLAGSGLTALYAARVVSLVFLGPTQRPHALHVPQLMKVVTGVLAGLTTITWLIAGPLSVRMAESLPFHEIETQTTWHLVQHLLSDPATYLTVTIGVAGLALWVWRARWAVLVRWLSPVHHAAASGFGFEQLNHLVLTGFRRTAAALARTQTGHLNWNAAGLVGALVLLFALLIWRYL